MILRTVGKKQQPVDDIIADYRAGIPCGLIAKKYKIAAGIYPILKKNNVPLRGLGVFKGQPSPYWDDFLIRPTKKEIEQSRRSVLSMIRPEEFNPIGTL